ncbi:MAG TPA: hypothetical protein VL371_06110 [Gemmataceae bacterium]|nr:hypothetical protein [Gemmataceae bacterium]
MATIRIAVYALIGAVLCACAAAVIYSLLSPFSIAGSIIPYGLIMFACAGAVVGAIAAAAQTIVEAIAGAAQAIRDAIRLRQD